MKPLALVYNGQIRDNGTPCYFRVALEETIGASNFDWYQHASEAKPGHAFYLHIDDGRDDLFQVPPKPNGFYCTDSHLGPEVRRAKAERFDIVWCAQRPFAERLQAEGIDARWLPLACYPLAHPTAFELRHRLGDSIPERTFDVAFVGFLQDPAQSSRVSFLDALFKAFPNFRLGIGLFHEDMARVYHRARIGLNHAIRDDLNMRFFEIASVGTAQLCDERMVGLNDLGFVPHEDFIPYSTAEEAIANARAYLERPEALARMADRAWAKVRANHTYVHRVETILEEIECRFLSQASNRATFSEPSERTASALS